LTANTDRVKEATTELRKTYYPHPQSLLWLLHLLTSHDVAEIRQIAAVEALKLVPKHWADGISADQKPAIREKLLESTLSEQKALVRHSSARVIAAIAKIDLPDGDWDAQPLLLKLRLQKRSLIERLESTYCSLYWRLQGSNSKTSYQVSSHFSAAPSKMRKAQMYG
jgi:hypothetical protein